MQFLAANDAVPEACRKPVLVMGCGNVLFGDDGLGPAVIERLEVMADDPLRERVCLLDAGTSARTVLFDLLLSEPRPRRLVIVDAVDLGRTPGELVPLSLDDLPAAKLDDFSMHLLPASNLLKELRDACGVSVKIVACQVGVIPDEVAPGLSDPVRRALPRVCQAVLEEVGNYDPASGESRPRQRGDPATGAEQPEAGS